MTGRRGAVGRAGWGIADQALSSLTNFAVGVFVARALAPDEFGAFALALAAYWLALGTSRAIASEPFLVRHSESTGDARRRAVRAAAGAVTVVGTCAGLACVLVGWSVGGTLGQALLAVGVVMPALLLQDFWRFAFFAEGRGSLAFANDLCWTLVLIPFLVIALGVETRSVGWFVLAWGGSAAVAAALGAVQSRSRPAVASALHWWRAHQDLAPRYLGEFFATLGPQQLAFYLVGAIAGLVSVGALRAGQILLGPLNVLFMGIGLMAVPEGIRLLKRSPAQLERAAKLLSVGLAGAAVAWGSLALLLPASAGSALLGESWQGAREVVFVLALAMAGSGAMSGAFVGLRSLAAARRSLRVRLIGAPLTVVGGAAGAFFHGAEGAALGLAVALWASAAVSWWQFREALKQDAEEEPRAAPSRRGADAPVAGTVGGA